MASTVSDTKPGHRVRADLRNRRDRGNVYAPDCPSRAILDHAVSRWGALVLVQLLDGTHRFSELSAVIGASDKMLSQTLKQLAADGLVVRHVEPDPPVRVSYRLSEPGEAVASRLADLIEWIEENIGLLMEASQGPTSD